MSQGYAIETVDLTKRYPTRAGRGEGGFRGGGGMWGVGSFANILGALRGNRGPFIEALRGVSLAVKKGEVFGLLGPNGAGKSTLIKILCTLVIHDEGKALVNGIDVKKQPSRVLKNLQAVLPESRGFSWRLSGRQNLEFYALMYGLGKEAAKDRIDYLFQVTDLKDRENDDYQRYSTGMQRKLLLCRALLRDTSCLLFDEPTSGLDPASAVEFRRLLRDKLAREEGRTVFMSTHNLAEAQDICDRIAILNRGKVTACDTPANVQYALSDEKVFALTFVDAMSLAEQSQLLQEIERLSGVRRVVPELDGPEHFSRLSVHVEREMALSAILDLLSTNELKIAAVNTREPTLEEVFTTMTRRRGAGRGSGPEGAREPEDRR